MADESDAGMLNKESLANGLALFPTLVFDWHTPASSDGSTTSSSSSAGVDSAIDYETAAKLFRRMDSDGDGFMTALDLRVWRQSLPIGRPEDNLLRSFQESLASRQSGSGSKSAGLIGGGGGGGGGGRRDVTP
jgi:hypothetical protein